MVGNKIIICHGIDADVFPSLSILQGNKKRHLTRNLFGHFYEFVQISQQQIVQVCVLIKNCIKLYRGIKNNDKLNQQTTSNKNVIISPKEGTTTADIEMEYIIVFSRKFQ